MREKHRENYYRSIGRLILLSMIFVPAIPFVLSFGIGYCHFNRSLETGTIASMKRIVGDHRQMIESFLDERVNDLVFLMASTGFSEMSSQEVLLATYQRLRVTSPAFIDLGVFDENGRHVTYHGPYALKGRNYREEDWFRAVMREDVYISDIFLGYRHVPHFIIAVARTDENRRWVVRATIDSGMFSNLVEGVRIGRTGEAFLLNAEGALQTRPRSGGELMDRHPMSSLQLPEKNNDILTYIAESRNGVPHLYATTWLRNKEWLLVVRLEKADAFSALRSAVYGVAPIALLGIFIMVAVAFYLTGRIVSRMREMDTEKEALGHQLIRAQRLAELGEMAAGFAHEINNPLQIIRSEHALIRMVLNDLREAEILAPSESLTDLEDSLAQISLQIDRCAAITQSILKFGRQGAPAIQDVDLRSFIPQVVHMVEKKASVNGVSITCDVAENTPPVHGDPGQLQQVLLNLFNNALDAIDARSGAAGGLLCVESRPAGEKRVVIRVSDTGCGIPAEDLKKVFSPFFTTKPVGKGTGLGLSVCYGIIESMGGGMAVESEADQGTTFIIQLPAAA